MVVLSSTSGESFPPMSGVLSDLPGRVGVSRGGSSQSSLGDSFVALPLDSK